MRSFLLALAIAALPAPAAAQSPAPAANDDEEVNCLLLATMWGGTADEVRHMRTQPVPQSYRETYRGRCEDFGWPMESLVTWHFAYGDAASTAAALAWLETHFTEGAPPPERLPRLLAEAVRAAAPFVLAAEPDLVAGGERYARATRAFRRNPRVRRVSALTGARDRLLFLARQYVRAAEVFGAPAFLAKANLYLAPVRDSIAQVRPPDAEDRLGVGPDDNDGVEELELRLAVAAARIGGGEAGRREAEAALARLGSAAIRLAADHAYGDGTDFCDIEARDDLAPLREACDEDDGLLARRAIAWWLSRAELDLLADPANAGTEPESYRLVKRLFEHAVADGSIRTPSRDPQILLLLARADQLVRAARAALARGGQGAGSDADDLLRDALRRLAEAERMAPPPLAPSWFRRIAEAWLAIAADLEARHAGDSERRRNFPVDPRMTAYFRHSLAAIDRIAVGD